MKQSFRFAVGGLALIWVTCCGQPVPIMQWDTVIIDTEIPRDTVFTRLDQRPELFSRYEKQDSLMKRTSDVAYVITGPSGLAITRDARFNNCRAYRSDPDSLLINIGIGTGFGGRGFIIGVRGKRFHVKPYWVTDVVVPDRDEPVLHVLYQQLRLNQANYSVGDSLYGYVDFRCRQADKNADTTWHAGRGYFRAKVMHPER